MKPRSNTAAASTRRWLVSVITMAPLTLATACGEEPASHASSAAATDDAGSANVSTGGACGNACAPGEFCSDGECVDRCPVDKEACGQTCIDIRTDPLNCGACGTGCAPTESCQNGACGCPPSSTLCPSGCVDTSSDAENCGACGSACPSGQVCSSSMCRAGCEPGRTQCGSSCFDLSSDPAHCGDCDSACPTGMACIDGSCGCRSGTTLCADTCRDTQTDAAHCGGCDVPCPSGQICNGGSCQCPIGQTLCDDTCVDTSSSDEHCGSCLQACGPGAACAGGACEGGVLELTGIPANTTVGLEWPRVSAATSYRVYWSTAPGVTATSTQYFDATEPATVHRGLTNGVAYYYSVTATTATGEGPPSNEISIVPEGEWVLEELGAGDFDDVITGARVPRLPIERRVHVLLLPEGYLAGELSSAFHNTASHDGDRSNDVDRWVDEVFGIDPYPALREAFVIWYLPRASDAHIGAGQTAFGLTISQGSVSSTANAAGPLWGALDDAGSDAFLFPPGVPVENHIAAFMLLDPITQQSGYSGMATTLDNPSNGQQRIRSAFARGHAHEFTHSFSEVRDEYLEDNNTITSTSETSNVAHTNVCADLPWAHLLDGAGINDTPDLVGAFGVSLRGYRSELKCLMNGSHENGKYYCGDETVTLALRSNERLCNFCRELTAYRVFDHTGILPGTSGFDTWKTDYRSAFFERFGFFVPATVPQTLTCPGQSTIAPDEPCVP